MKCPDRDARDALYSNSWLAFIGGELPLKTPIEDTPDRFANSTLVKLYKVHRDEIEPRVSYQPLCLKVFLKGCFRVNYLTTKIESACAGAGSRKR